MKYRWETLPEPLRLFTKRNAVLLDLTNGRIVQHYSANTKIQVTQRCVHGDKTFYRTESAASRSLNWAFEASAFGLPNELAPSVPSSSPKVDTGLHTLAKTSRPRKQKAIQATAKADDGEPAVRTPFWRRLFKR